MPVKEPDWWYRDGRSWQSFVLRPAAKVYGALAARRLKSGSPYRSRRPVICVGNFTAGGTGKTPMALAIADIVTQMGWEPWFLSRGYGGRLDGQERVDLTRHRAIDVGDEPILLARRAPTVISQNRHLGAEFIERQAPSNAIIIMDDGLQNPALVKDLRLALVDSARGFGNGYVIPAGPLRAPFSQQAGLVDAIVMMGEGCSIPAEIDRAFQGQKLQAKIAAESDTSWLQGQSVIAYAGIANPNRFFDLVEKLGGKASHRKVFNDHHAYSDTDAEELLRLADQSSALLVTTEKDHVRLHGTSGPRLELSKRSKSLGIRVAFDEKSAAALKKLIADAVDRHSRG